MHAHTHMYTHAHTHTHTHTLTHARTHTHTRAHKQYAAKVERQNRVPYSRLFTWGATFADVFNLPRAGYFH